MKRNMGVADRVIRFIIGLTALVISLVPSIVDSLALQIVLWVVAALMLVTSYIGVCPAYMLFHISTNKK